MGILHSFSQGVSLGGVSGNRKPLCIMLSPLSIMNTGNITSQEKCKEILLEYRKMQIGGVYLLMITYKDVGCKLYIYAVRSLPVN